MSQTLNRSASCSKDLANNNLPHLLSPKESKSKTEFDFNMGPSSKLPEQAAGAKYGHSKPSSTRSQPQQQQSSRHANTLQSGAEKQHGRHAHSMADSAHGSMSSSSKSSASYLSLSKSHSALSDAKSVGNLSDGRLHPDDPASGAATGVGVGARFFPASCLDLNAPSGPPGPPGSPSARHSDRSGHSPASRSSGTVRMESSTLDSSARRTSRHKSVAPGRLMGSGAFSDMEYSK